MRRITEREALYMKWTDQQERAIAFKGSDILVSAAAGSGKTAVLTERIKRMIIDEGLSVDNMLIVTFSNAAAAEMKEKIIKALRKAASELPEHAARLHAQIRHARTADISTFHKFSMGIIRRYFYLTDIDQDFGICDESRRIVMIEEALDELFEARFAEESEGNTAESGADMTFTEFLRMYADVRSEENIRDMIKEVYRFIMSMPYPFKWLSAAVEAVNNDIESYAASRVYELMRDDTVKQLKRAIRIYESVVDDTAELPSIAQKAEEDMAAIRNALDAAADKADSSGERLKAALEIDFKVFRASKDDKEGYALIKDMTGAKRDAVKKIIKELRDEQFTVSLPDAVGRVRDTYRAARYLEELVADFHQRFTVKKREKNLLDFNDIEHVALEILEKQEIAGEYRKHFEVIFVDEYQDSSIIQETLIQRIGRGDNVYMVGDVKQSIYKFRLAEPEIFIDKYNDFRDGTRPGERIDLNKNFRSKGNIINSVNAVFRNIMNRDTCGIDYDDDAALNMGGTYEGPLDRPTSLHLINTDISEESSEEIDEEILELKKTELEARVTAELAASRIGQEIYDSKNDCVRKIGPSDIVVLLRSVKGRADVYAAALKEAGLPAYVEAGEGYFETTEIQTFMNLLSLIDNRNSDIPLLSVLYSPVFDYSIDELTTIRLYDRTVAYNEAFYGLAAAAELKNESYEALDSGLQTLASKNLEVCRRLDKWRAYARYMPLETFLWRLMRETDYLDYVTALPGGDRRAANLRSLVDKAVDFSSSQSKGLFDFLRYVRAMNEGNVQIGQSLQADGGEHMVRIMTIHKSKGLEFPVVILAGLGTGFSRDKNTGSIILHKELGIALQYSDPDRHCMSRTLTQSIIAKQKRREQLAEEMRILYVAMTRPMDELIMLGAMKDLDAQLEKYRTGTRGGTDGARCFLDWIVPYSEEGGMRLVLHSRQTLSETAASGEAKSRNLEKLMQEGFPEFKDTEGLAARLAERFAYKYPYTGDVETKSKFAVSELNKVLRGRLSLDAAEKNTLSEQSAAASEKEYEVPAFLQDDVYISPARRGTLIHKVLELLPFDREYSAEDIKSFVDGLPEKGFMTEEEAACVDCGRIAAFFESEVGSRLRKAKWIRKEWPFTLRKRKEEIAAMAASQDIKNDMLGRLADEVMIQGIIDCCFCDDRGITILDYKSDRVDTKRKKSEHERIAEEYRRQLELYCDVISRALGEAVNEKILFLLDSGDAISIL